MFRNVMLAAVTWVAFSGTAAAQQVLTPDRAIPDQYIVVFDDAQATRAQVASEAQALTRQHGPRILHAYRIGLRLRRIDVGDRRGGDRAQSTRPLRRAGQRHEIVASQPAPRGGSIASISAICRSTAPTPTTPVR